jgi:hypothetical protein
MMVDTHAAADLSFSMSCITIENFAQANARQAAMLLKRGVWTAI